MLPSSTRRAFSYYGSDEQMFGTDEQVPGRKAAKNSKVKLSDLVLPHSNFADNLRTPKSMNTTTSLAIMIAVLVLVFVQFNALHNIMHNLPWYVMDAR
jgi:hypothetical protein